MNSMVASVISAMVKKPQFSEAIKEKIGSAVDTTDMEKQLETLQGQLRQALGTKSRLEKQMDNLDVSDAYYDRKILDLQRRYDEQYGKIEEIEIQIDDVQSQIRSIRQEKISGDNIYQLLLAFDEVYGSASEAEQKEFMRAFIERIELFPEKREDGNWIRNIVFNFPVPVNGGEVKELPLEYESTVETVISLSRKTPDDHIEIDLDLDELDATSAETKATYEEIKEYVLKETGLKVSTLYISQIKRKCGLEARDNYNLSKKENARVPQCPPDKGAGCPVDIRLAPTEAERRQAIRAALKHFAMI